MDYQLGPGPLQVDQNTIDEKIKGDIGIVENGDVATHAITSGYYVIWKGDLYVAKTDISSGTTLSAASNGNLTAKPNGLGAEVAALNSKITKGEQEFIQGGGNFTIEILRLGRLRVLNVYNGNGLQTPISIQLAGKDKPLFYVNVGAWAAVDGNGTFGSRFLNIHHETGVLSTSGDVYRGGWVAVYIARDFA